MCWNIRVSLCAAAWGFSVCIYLYRRNYSNRDPWYALFLGSFTSLQLFDAYYWWLRGDSEDIPCTASNYYITKFLLPVVVFLQPMVLSVFPSNALLNLRTPYRIVTAFGCSIPIFFSAAYGCTTIWRGKDRDELLWGGVMPPALIVDAGLFIWASGAVAFVRPWQAWRDILLVGCTVLSLLVYIDGSYRLISRMCTYCLILSFVWILEPIWMPPDAHLETRQRQERAQKRTPAIEKEEKKKYMLKERLLEEGLST